MIIGQFMIFLFQQLLSLTQLLYLLLKGLAVSLQKLKFFPAFPDFIKTVSLSCSRPKEACIVLTRNRARQNSHAIGSVL